MDPYKEDHGKMQDIFKALEKRLKGTVKDFLVEAIKKQKRVFISDTTLRDGEQAPGAALGIEDKLEIAMALDRLGVDSIEAGFPVSSAEDFEAVKLIAKKVRRPVITALCRCNRGDIDCAKEALKGARRWGLALFMGTSPILRKYSVKKKKDEVIKTIKNAIIYAKKFTDSIAFGAEDASRTEPEFLYKVYTSAIDAGALVIGFPDTVGNMTPDEVADAISGIKANVHNLHKAFLAVHFHDDLGLAVANALTAIKNNVNIIQCTVNGIGERAGNTSLEEIAVILKAKREYFKVKLGINTRHLFKTSQLVSRLTGLGISTNKAIVGDNVFASEAGIHQAALLKSRNTYDFIKPQDVGQKEIKLVLGRHSGKHALINRINRLKIRLPKIKRADKIDRIYRQFKELAGTKKIITDSDLASLVKGALKEE